MLLDQEVKILKHRTESTIYMPVLRSLDLCFVGNFTPGI